MDYLIAIAFGYLLGCSNMAWYLARMKGVDLRAGGSGSPGASNATILMGWKAGVLVAIHDIGKAFLAVWLAKFLFPEAYGIAEAAGVACVLGHIFPFYLKFRGGKGFASFIGMMLALDWKFSLVILAALVIVTVVTDYIVVGTTMIITSLPVYMAVTMRAWIPVMTVCIATVVIICKHRQNYVRIYKGTEIGLRSTIKGEHRVK